MDHPNTQALYRYWNDLRAGRDAPCRSEVDPRRISGSLETMFILEALDNGQMRFRLAGTKLCEWLGMEARGCVAETVMARGHEGELPDLARRVLRTPGIGVMRLRALDGAGTDWPGEALLLPLRSELGDLARVIGCVNLESEGPRRRVAPPLRLRCLGARLTPIETDPAMARPADRERRFADPLGGGDLADATGFAAPLSPFGRATGLAETRPTLTAIEGNPTAARPRGAGRRPNLRIVKD
ncbi:PAS domain-containing protein [Albimonas sp. CAU 1670]|uniref:PAS domain-containing protein n=1 Tax=Albimonas sp. CAU 1670 TaxID=3032599 RepID=UPI0023DA8F6F|nr:PAS domain-containing protein [Albimonas sp. CAU 1670]MDF2232114.1 PAS domain-containing protein [Albimonas sp. CAU 1670]